MTEFKPLVEGEQPAEPTNHVLIEKVYEPVLGTRYKVTIVGQMHSQIPTPETMPTLADARDCALDFAKRFDVPVIYLSNEITREAT
jgi:hypothetical protein